MNTVNDYTSKMYDLIDTEDYDQAIKLGEHATLRQFSLPTALLGYCYAIKKRVPEAVEACERVMIMRAYDEGTLAALTATLKICRKEELLTSYYEMLCGAFPDNQEFMQKLFGMHIKQGDGKKMQLLAQKLYKKEGDKKYVFWVVGSMLQQIDLPPMMLTVAEKMIYKVFYEIAKPSAKLSIAEAAKATKASQMAVENQPGAEEIELYVEVLKKQGKTRDAFIKLKELYKRPKGPIINEDKDFKQDGSCVKMHGLRYHMLCTDLLITLLNDTTHEEDKINFLLELKEIQRTILLDYSDQWNAHQLLLTLEATSTSDGSGNKCNVTNLVAYRNYIIEFQEKSSYLRGPYLAEMELLCIWANQKQTLPNEWKITTSPDGYVSKDDTTSATIDEEKYSNSVDSELAVLVCKYIFKFQSKQCCFSDIKKYMQMLSSIRLASLQAWAKIQRVRLEEELNILVNDNVPYTNTGKSKKGKKKASGSSTTNDDISEITRNKAVVLLCSYSKMGQVEEFASYLQSVSVSYTSLNNKEGNINYDQEENHAIDIFEKTRFLCENGIGGDKEVQPGDEILLLSSVHHRTINNQTGPVNSIDTFSSFARWCYLLETGIKASPYSYALKVEIFSPYRELACAEEIQEQFSLLKVRHVQNDSLSYLLLPSLIECGFYSLAKRQHLNVLTFHKAALRDTADMIAESFKHANYTKGLEMKRFLAMCTNSMQLALTNAEFPLIEIIDNSSNSNNKSFSFTEIAKYLEDYVAKEAMPYMEDHDLDALRDNNDFALLIRCDDTDSNESKAKALRRKQCCARIREAQITVRMLSAAINAETDIAQEHLDNLMKNVRERLNSNSISVNISVEDITLENKSSKSTNFNPQSIQWDQAFKCGGNDFESCVWNGIENIMNLCLSAARTLQASLSIQSESDNKDNNYATNLQSHCKKTQELVNVCVESLIAIGEMLTAEDPHFVPNGINPNEIQLPFRPQWIHRISFFTRTVAPWGTLLLKAATESLPKDKDNKEKPKNTTKVTEGCSEDIKDPLNQVSSSVKQVLDHIQKLMDSIQKVLTQQQDILMGGSTSSSEYEYKEILEMCQPVVENISDATQCDVIKKIMKGQSATSVSIQAVLQGMLNIIRS
jgi:hypothetical protein